MQTRRGETVMNLEKTNVHSVMKRFDSGNYFSTVSFEANQAGTVHNLSHLNGLFDV